ncbi:hypothetical protein IF2G_11060 [Cordyceps javanica]|nr:hypothetical protein IF2G_11060 [Cordyceps javanica]
MPLFVTELPPSRGHLSRVNIKFRAGKVYSGGRHYCPRLYETELSQARNTPLRATRPAAPVPTAWYRAQKYATFRGRVKEECDETIQKLCDIVIRKGWIKHIRASQIEILHAWLESDAKTELGNEARKRAFGNAASAPATVPMHAQDMALESTEDTVVRSTMQDNHWPSPAIAAPPEPSGNNITLAHVKWTRQGVAACFSDKFVRVTEGCEGRNITFSFPEMAHVGCFITFHLDLTTTQRLAEAVLDAAVYFIDDESSPSNIDRSRMVVTGELRLPVVSCDTISDVLGGRILKYVDDTPGRRVELQHKMGFHKSGVRMILAKEGSQLSVTTSVREGRNIEHVLRTST